jgi:regulator of RNase E activity RraA
VTIGGVRITPGDWVVGDDDGVVVVPFEIADRVLAEAEEKAAAENKVRSAIREGMTPLAAYDEYGAF